MQKNAANDSTFAEYARRKHIPLLFFLLSVPQICEIALI